MTLVGQIFPGDTAKKCSAKVQSGTLNFSVKTCCWMEALLQRDYEPQTRRGYSYA